MKVNAQPLSIEPDTPGEVFAFNSTGNMLYHYLTDSRFSEGLLPARLIVVRQKDKNGRWYDLSWQDIKETGITGKWGFMNHDKEIVILSVYDTVNRFENGFAVVKFNGKWGVIDDTGNEVIACKYDGLRLNRYTGRRIVVQEGEKWGIIDRSGNEIVPIRYDAIYSEKRYTGIKVGEKWGIADYFGNELTAPKYDKIRYDSSADVFFVWIAGKCGIVDHTGKEIIIPEYTYIKALEEGIFIVNIGGEPYDRWSYHCRGGKWGVIGKTGKMLIPVEYDDIRNISSHVLALKRNGKHALSDKNGRIFTPFNYSSVDSYYEWVGNAIVRMNGKAGAISEEGKEIIVPKFDDLSNEDCPKGLIRAEKKGKWGLINVQGKEVTPIKYDKIDPFYRGFAKVVIGEKVGLIDERGKEQVPVKFDYIVGYPASSGFTLVKLNGKYLYIDTLGREIEPVYDFSTPFYNDFAVVVSGENYAVIDTTGKVVLSLEKYERADRIYKGLIPVKLDNKWGAVNLYGEIITPFQYDDIESFRHGFATVKIGRKAGVINHKGKEIVPVNFDDVEHWNRSYRHHQNAFIKVKVKNSPSGFQMVRKLRDKIWGVIDTTGKEITPVKCDEIDIFYSEEHQLIKVGLDEKWGIVNAQGHEILPPKYHEVGYFSEGLAKVMRNDQWGYINTNGDIVIPLFFDDAESFKDGRAKVVKNGRIFWIDKTGEEIKTE